MACGYNNVPPEAVPHLKVKKLTCGDSKCPKSWKSALFKAFVVIGKLFWHLIMVLSYFMFLTMNFL